MRSAYRRKHPLDALTVGLVACGTKPQARRFQHISPRNWPRLAGFFLSGNRYLHDRSIRPGRTPRGRNSCPLCSTSMAYNIAIPGSLKQPKYRHRRKFCRSGTNTRAACCSNVLGTIFQGRTHDPTSPRFATGRLLLSRSCAIELPLPASMSPPHNQRGAGAMRVRLRLPGRRADTRGNLLVLRSHFECCDPQPQAMRS